jgi:hypothetical protein
MIFISIDSFKILFYLGYNETELICIYELNVIYKIIYIFM